MIKRNALTGYSAGARDRTSVEGRAYSSMTDQQRREIFLGYVRGTNPQRIRTKTDVSTKTK